MISDRDLIKNCTDGTGIEVISVEHIAKLITKAEFNEDNEPLAIERTLWCAFYYALKGNNMITAKLVDGIAIKECIKCKYKTASADKMLSHLNEHRLDEIIELKASPKNQDRYGGMR